MTDPRTYTVYFGGELFSTKHLLGNAALAGAIRRRSQGRYVPILPQDLEQRDTSAQAIRDQDIRTLLACDLGLFNYDGPELDSGTVVEFMFAKFADIPSVLVRTDFRGGGDQIPGCDPWNLMTSFYPRTATVILDAMGLYQHNLIRPAAPRLIPLDHQETGQSGNTPAAQTVIDLTADKVIAAFDRLLTTPSVLPRSMRETVYRWLSLMPGFRADPEKTAAEFLGRCAAKEEKGLL